MLFGAGACARGPARASMGEVARAGRGGECAGGVGACGGGSVGGVGGAATSSIRGAEWPKGSPSLPSRAGVVFCPARRLSWRDLRPLEAGFGGGDFSSAAQPVDARRAAFRVGCWVPLWGADSAVGAAAGLATCVAEPRRPAIDGAGDGQKPGATCGGVRGGTIRSLTGLPDGVPLGLRFSNPHDPSGVIAPPTVACLGVPAAYVLSNDGRRDAYIAAAGAHSDLTVIM